MTPDAISQASNALSVMFSAFVWGTIVPLVMFAAWVIGMWWMMASAQRNDPTFRANEILREVRGGKVSSKRFMSIGTWILHSMIMVLATINKAQNLEELLWFYGVLWSGTAVAMRALELFAGRSGVSTQERKHDDFQRDTEPMDREAK